MDIAVVRFLEMTRLIEYRFPDIVLPVDLYFEFTMVLFDSGAASNIISHKMFKMLVLHMYFTNRSVKVANCALEKRIRTLNEVTIIIEECFVHIGFLGTGGDPA